MNKETIVSDYRTTDYLLPEVDVRLEDQGMN
jgi:hypothetical protein